MVGAKGMLVRCEPDVLSRSILLHSQLNRHELPQSCDPLVHVVLLGKARGEEDALVVLGCDDEVVLAVGEVAAFLGLVAGDDKLAADALAEEIGARGRGLATPDELIDGARAALEV